MGSDESHFNASLIVRDKVTRQSPQTTAFKEKGEPKRIRTEGPASAAYQPNALPLGQTRRRFTGVKLSRQADGMAGNKAKDSMAAKTELPALNGLGQF